MIDDLTLTELRSLSDSALPETATVAREGSFAPDGSGGGSWTPNSHEIACRFAPLGNSPRERVIAERHVEGDVGRLTTAIGADLRVGDLITFRDSSWKVEGSLERSSFAVGDDWVIAKT